MLKQRQNAFVLLSLSALLLAFIGHCSANTQFIVGDSAGWVIPPYPTYYSNWSHSHFMRVDDSLEFDFDPRFYNLIQVSQYEYEHCTSIEPLKVFNSSPAIIPLKERGVFFFMCSISNYCCLGQKISISVHEIAPKNPPSPSQAPITSPPLSSPNGSAPNGTVAHPPATSPMGNSSTAPGGSDGGNSPVPSSTQRGHKSNAVALVCGTSFIVPFLHVLGTFLGLWVMQGILVCRVHLD